MARIRTIKPEHWSDKQLSTIPIQAHLLWIGTWNFSDDKGVFEGDPILLKAQIFPRRTDIRVEQISQWLGQLVKARFLIPFEFEGEGYYINRTFGTHQRIDKAQPSKIPTDVIEKAFQEHSKNIPRTLYAVKDSRVEESIGEDIMSDFEVFWNLYAKKKDTAKCKDKWTRMSKEDKVAALSNVEAYVKSTPDDKYRKNPLTWLNGKCWLDDVSQSPKSNYDYDPKELERQR